LPVIHLLQLFPAALVLPVKQLQATVMKGMILAAGRGTRLRPLTNSCSKPMLPVANQPLISYPLRRLTDEGIEEITIVAGENEAELRAGLPEITAAELKYVRQPEPLGLAHAVDCGRPAIGADDFVLLFCDNIFSEPLADSLSDWRRLSLEFADIAAMIHVVTVDDPRAFGVAVVDDGWVVDMEEKPQNPRSNLAVVGIDFLKPQIFDAISRISPSARGELEITDALFELTRMGYRVRARQLPGFWYDTGTFADLIDVLKPVMDASLQRTEAGEVRHSEVTGLLTHEAGASVTDCVITGPVAVAKGAQVHSCRLGPYVAIGPDAEVHDCELRQVQIYPGTALAAVQLSDAIVSGDTTIRRDTQPFQ